MEPEAKAQCLRERVEAWRRADGRVFREEYQNEAKNRKVQALALNEKGLSHRAIGEGGFRKDHENSQNTCSESVTGVSPYN